MSAWKARGLAAALLLLAFLFVDASSNDAQALRPRGVWSAAVSYALDDLVALRGSTWRSRHNNNLNKLPGSTSPTTAADWELFSGGFNPLGLWSSTRTYQRNDLVIFGGSTWRSGRTNLNKIPGQAGNGLDWVLFASKGATGARGATGATGPQGPQGVPGSTAVGNGTATAPAFKFTSSPDTGIYSPGGGKIAMTTNGSLFLHDIGADNTALGLGALSVTTTGRQNTALGAAALLFNTEGEFNTAVGLAALQNNTTGDSNTAVGRLALLSNETGNSNTAVGLGALQDNTDSNNTAVGSLALTNNTTGSQNTALGDHALFSNSDGDRNTALGFEALQSNVGGSDNTALGYRALSASIAAAGNTAIGREALLANTTGANNTAVGHLALDSNLGGSGNVAVGFDALSAVTTGAGNVAIGQDAGFFATNPSNSIFIRNSGAAADTLTIKIGSQGTQTSAFIAGITGATPANAAAVVINTTTGQLGLVASSRRYKEDIHSMGAMSDVLSRLRPVSFRYKKPTTDGSKPIEYGLIAEEVAEVFPYLAVFNEHGQPETVKYHLLPTFLLEGFQEQQRIIAGLKDENARQQATIDAQSEQIDELEAQAERVAELESRLAAIEALLQPPAITAASASR